MINERRLYQKNQIGYLLMLLFIVTNAIYSVFTLNGMDTTQALGVFIMTTIVMLLLGFLIAVKVRIYSLGWSYAAIVLGLFQIGRLLFVESSLDGTQALIINLLLVASGLFSIASGIISRISALLRRQCLDGEEVLC